MERDEAKQVWEAAVADIEGGNHDAAIAGFNRIFDEYANEAQKARAAYNIALAWLRQGNNEGAMEWWGHWLGMGAADQSRRPEVLESFWQAWKGVQTDLAAFYDLD